MWKWLCHFVVLIHICSLTPQPAEFYPQFLDADTQNRSWCVTPSVEGTGSQSNQSTERTVMSSSLQIINQWIIPSMLKHDPLIHAVHSSVTCILHFYLYPTRCLSSVTTIIKIFCHFLFIPYWKGSLGHSIQETI